MPVGDALGADTSVTPMCPAQCLVQDAQMRSPVTDGRKVGIVPVASPNTEKSAVCGMPVDGNTVMFLCLHIPAQERCYEQYQPSVHHVLFVFE